MGEKRIVMEIWELLYFKDISKGLYFSKEGNSTLGITYLSPALKGHLRHIGFLKGTSEHLPLLFLSERQQICSFTSRTMQSKRTVLNMVNTRKETRLAMMRWMSISPNWVIMIFTFHIRFSLLWKSKLY